jgi:methylated-DNA-[protein]-cysteine S-methyltransferase
MTSYTLFETAIGWAGLAWGDKGLVGAYLPEADRETARKSFLRRFPEAAEAAPTPMVEGTIAAIRALLTGEPADLTHVPIDLARVPEFNARVYEIARAIPPGETLTYGEIAVKLGDRLLARDVGAALGRNPWPIVVPCHRVTAAGGKLGGFSARGGVNTKVKLLAIEGAKVLEPAPPKAKPARPSRDRRRSRTCRRPTAPGRRSRRGARAC